MTNRKLGGLDIPISICFMVENLVIVIQKSKNFHQNCLNGLFLVTSKICHFQEDFWRHI